MKLQEPAGTRGRGLAVASESFVWVGGVELDAVRLYRSLAGEWAVRQGYNKAFDEDAAELRAQWDIDQAIQDEGLSWLDGLEAIMESRLSHFRKVTAGRGQGRGPETGKMSDSESEEVVGAEGIEQPTPESARPHLNLAAGAYAGKQGVHRHTSAEISAWEWQGEVIGRGKEAKS